MERNLVDARFNSSGRATPLFASCILFFLKTKEPSLRVTSKGCPWRAGGWGLVGLHLGLGVVLGSIPSRISLSKMYLATVDTF